ncbi:hypothetical protein TD95_000297 [Thielaviopsis punctulata]|uniref:Amidase domain-containing protein n=1 Tax=Thielaviopsis punctulata TaxID=72032 RepID=A0A0F4ZFG5_9PEZI|nr:hypothetical protein TD95_000297 [Thielaviopsis punctulata]
MPDFVDYPAAREASQWASSEAAEDQNPVLRGRMLVAAGNIVSRVPALQGFLWSNAGFGSLRDVQALAGVNPRFTPLVIPTANSASADLPSPTHFHADLFQSRSADILGRYHTAADYYNAYKTGEVTPLQVAEALHSLILRGQTPRSKYDNAWVDSHGADHLALEAARRSTERWKKGEPLGLLDGVPFGVKDDLDVKGYVSHMGLKYQPNLSYQKPAKSTIHPVKMLEEAGAIVIAKNSMHELGCDTTGCNPAWGTATNWHNPSYFPGGSSSGAGSSLGAGIIPFALGTDAGGSTRIPPCFNGVYGLKTTHNRTMSVIHTMCVVCPMAATVADLTVAYRVIAQQDPEDGITSCFVPSPLRDATAPKYLGIDWDWVNKADKAVVTEFNKGIDHLKTLGYEVVDITIPNLKEYQLAHGAACLTEMAEQHRSRIGKDANWMSTVNNASKIMLGVGSQTPGLDYIKYNQLRTILMGHIAFLFKKYPGILIMSPTSPQIGWARHPDDEAFGVNDANISLRNMIYVFLANMTGCPALSAPIGFVDPRQGEGRLPIGMMAMGEWGTEETLLAWAGETEAYLQEKYPGGRVRPAGWIDVLQYTKDKAQEADGVKNVPGAALYASGSS